MSISVSVSGNGITVTASFKDSATPPQPVAPDGDVTWTEYDYAMRQVGAPVVQDNDGVGPYVQTFAPGTLGTRYYEAKCLINDVPQVERVERLERLGQEVARRAERGRPGRFDRRRGGRVVLGQVR